MKKYTTIQIQKETHILLQEYCKEHGYKLSGLVEKLIQDKIQQKKIVVDSTKVLKSEPIMKPSYL